MKEKKVADHYPSVKPNRQLLNELSCIKIFPVLFSILDCKLLKDRKCNLFFE